MSHRMNNSVFALLLVSLLVQGCADKKAKPGPSGPSEPEKPRTVTEYLDQSKNFYDNSPATYCSAILPREPSNQQLATYRIAQNAKTQGMERFFSFLTAHPDQLNVPDEKTGMPILHTLVQRNQVDIMNTMVEENFSVGLATKDAKGRYPLHYVNTQPMAEILWDLPILTDVNQPWSSRAVAFMNPDNDGQTPFHRVVVDGDVATVAFVVGKLCNDFHWPWENRSMNMADKDGRTALHLAVLGRKTMALEQLLKCDKVDVLARDAKGNTALHYAQACDDQEALWQLLAIGRGQKDVRNTAGRLPTQVAQKDCVKL